MTVPTTLTGLKVLDLGSGAGRDCYIVSKLVGEKGSVVGVDMTDEQLEVANRHIDYHREQFGYKKSNITFIKGDIERLDELGLEDNTFDLIISNCVINLVEDKKRVLKNAYRLLKEGGELYFSDVYSDRRVSEYLRKDPVLWGECLSGALYWNDFLDIAKSSGFKDPRFVEDHVVTVKNKELEKKLGNIKFYSVTYRLFKLSHLEHACEDYGQAVVYKGTLPEVPEGFFLDSHHYIEKGKMFPVCGNTYSMLNCSRFKEHFDFYGNFEKHYGIFDGCGLQAPLQVCPRYLQKKRAV